MLCMLGTSSAAWQRLPSLDVPINLANQAILGAKVQSSSGIGNPAALLNDAPGQRAAIPAGNSLAVITLGAQEVIEDVSFLNEGVSGSVTVSSSTNLNDWTSLAQASFPASEQLVSLRFAGAQAKYVRLSFNSTSSASIRSLKVSGPARVSDYKAVPLEDAKPVEVNLSAGVQGARPIYMYPTPSNAGEPEGARQVFRFPKTTERYRTVVYDLGSTRTIKKFNAAYSRVPTRLEIFAFEQLPEKKDWKGKLTLDPAIFDVTPATATGEDATGKGQLQLTPGQPVKARYVALRFEPNYNKRGVAGLNPDWEAMAFSAVFPYANLAGQLGLVDNGTFVQAPDAPGGGEDFTVISVEVGGASQTVFISNAAIEQVKNQLGPNATELQAINAILAAAGLPTLEELPPEVTVPGGTGGAVVGDPSAPLNAPALSALGLAAYRNGGTGGAGPGTTTDTGTTGTGGGGTTVVNNGGGSGGGTTIINPPATNPPPIVIVPTTP